ncbi:restriction endonuclease subunit S [Acinetobacter cumulans]|uniref:Restriction endonuclease subunit S n=1 Tax=Acinetobacter cumulans TaxID=2136182 RepID=A0A498CXM0_9GAMM|nr:restriction endonuclease subunit S [Acinetobacter cumulans]RLL32217.1 restriction endonuclease subunit S [Acinetobacter cumulans]
MAAPKLRFKEFSEDYNFSKFQEASIQIIDGDRGNNYPKSDDFYDNEYCLFLNAGNVTKSGFKFESTQFINKEKDALLRKGKLQKNDLVITTRGTVGNIAYFDESIPFENIRINSGMVIVRSEIDLEPIYLNQFLKSDLFEKWLEKNVFGSAQPQLTVKLLNSISISYPSKEEQTKIASFLSAVDEKISQLTQKHELLSQYKQGMMQKLFSQQIRFKADDGSEFGEWEELSLSKIFKLITDYVASGSFQSLRENVCPSDDGYAYYVRQVDLANGFKNATKFVDKASYDFLSKSNLFVGDILFTNIGASVGKVFILPELNKPATVAPNLILLRVNDYNNNLFIYQFLNSEYAQNAIQKIVGGTGMPKISKTDLKSLSFSLPSLEEQTKIANFLSAIDQKIEVVAQQIEHAKQWKKGLLQQMFV